MPVGPASELEVYPRISHRTTPGRAPLPSTVRNPDPPGEPPRGGGTHRDPRLFDPVLALPGEWNGRHPPTVRETNPPETPRAGTETDRCRPACRCRAEPCAQRETSAPRDNPNREESPCAATAPRRRRDTIAGASGDISDGATGKPSACARGRRSRRDRKTASR